MPTEQGWSTPPLRTYAITGVGVEATRVRWLLTRLGKRVLRPGGVQLTRWLLDALAVGRDDLVVELAAGSGVTARLTIARGPASYVGVGLDPSVTADLSALARRGTDVRDHRSGATQTGLPGRHASVVYGEAMLTTRGESVRRRVAAEAYRLLTPGGRYGIHELCLVPDDIESALAEEIALALGDSLHVGACPRTVPGWRRLLTDAGFAVTAEAIVPMRLLEPTRLVADEGLIGAASIAVRMLRDAPARRSVLQVRRVLRRYRRHLAAVALVAVRPGTDTGSARRAARTTMIGLADPL